MIKNEHQFKITNKLMRELQDALALLPTNSQFLSLKPLAKKAYSASLRRQLRQLEGELKEYECLRSGEFDFSQASTIKNAPSLLIKMRIARGIGQEDLAKLLKLKKQQIQQYEATDYASASLARILQVVDVLTALPAQRSTKVAAKRRTSTAKRSTHSQAKNTTKRRSSARS